MKIRNRAALLSVTLAFILAACGGGGGDAPSDTPVTGGGLAPAPDPVVAPVTPVVVPVTPIVEALTLAKQFLASYDAQRVTAIPATAVDSLLLTDSCSLSSGNTKASSTAEFNQDSPLAIASRQFDIGSTRKNISVVAERNTTNSDGSARREIDIQYAIDYADGSKVPSTTQTLITGSSFGSCATPQAGADVRFFGNRRLVDVYMQGRNLRTLNFYRQDTLVAVSGVPLLSGSLPYPTTTPPGGTLSYVVPAGAPNIFTPLSYRRDVLFGINDPAGKATYAIVTGPGPTTTVAGVTTAFSVKMLSPRLLRDDSALAGKTGNFTNWKDNDAFRFCRSSNGNVLNAAVVDCVANGGAGNNFGRMQASAGMPSLTQADDIFDSIGFKAGDYTFAIYNDDGWKTVNGQAGKTPIATYTVKLEKLPYTFVQMASTEALNPNADKFPRITGISQNTGQLAAALQLSTPSAFTTTWVAPAAPDADVWRLSFAGEYFEGAKTTNTAGAFWPAMRFFTPTYLSSTATAGSSAVTAKPADIGVKSYTEFSLTYTNRNGSRIISNVAFN